MIKQKIAKIKNELPARVPQAADLDKFMKLAKTSFGKRNFAITVDYCRTTVGDAISLRMPRIASEAYYLWCLANLQQNKFDEARQVCYDARRQLGNYLDIVYFELVIAAVNGETARVPKFAESFAELHAAIDLEKRDYGINTREKAGEVLLMWAQALEELGESENSIGIYEKYLAIHPEDKAIEDRLAELGSRSLN